MTSSARVPATASAVDPEPAGGMPPFVDPHHHLWPGGARPVNGLAKDVCFGSAPLTTQYLLEELAADARRLPLRATVFVEAHSFYDKSAAPHMMAAGESATVQRLAEQGTGSPASADIDFCRGIVGAVSLNRPTAEVEELLDAHARNARFRGVRHQIAYDPDTEGIFSSAQRGGVDRVAYDRLFRFNAQVLADRGIPLDVWAFHTQLNDVYDLARAVPSLVIVCDHVGMPLGVRRFAEDRDQVYRDWLAGMTRLASCPNVRIKIGGLTMPICGLPLGIRDDVELASLLRKWVEPAVRLLGAHRCMFESNFPMDKALISYTVLWHAFRRLCIDLKYSARETKSLFYATANEVYRLGLPDLDDAEFDLVAAARI